MIGADIVDLLKIWAQIPKNSAFGSLFLQQQILHVIQQFYKGLHSPQEVAKFIDSNILKVRLVTLMRHLYCRTC